MKPKITNQACFVLLMVLMIVALGIEIFIAFFSGTLIHPAPSWLPGEQVLISLNESHALENHLIRVVEPAAGLAGILLSLAALLILLTAFRKRKMWGWFALLLTAGLLWLMIAAESIPSGSALLGVIGVSGLFLFMGTFLIYFRNLFSPGSRG